MLYALRCSIWCQHHKEAFTCWMTYSDWIMHEDKINPRKFNKWHEYIAKMSWVRTCLLITVLLPAYRMESGLFFGYLFSMFHYAFLSHISEISWVWLFEWKDAFIGNCLNELGILKIWRLYFILVYISESKM